MKFETQKNIIGKRMMLSFMAYLIMIMPALCQEQGKENQVLFDELKKKDSLLFNLGFNNCDTTQFRMLLSDDFEFYHDQNGLLESKDMFIKNIPNLCKMSYKPIRVLVEGNMNVFPLYSNGQLYGAIQTGIHEFYGEEKGKARYLTSTAKFTHVWLIEDGTWKLKRILSYDHVIPEE